MKNAFVKNALPLLLTFLVGSAAYANEIVATAIPKTGTTAEQFCPPGWKVENKLTADLQGNGAKDQIIELISKKPGKNSNRVATDYRALVVTFEKAGKLELADYNTKLLLCSTCGGQLGANRDRVSNASTETSCNFENGVETITKTVDDKEKKSTKKFTPKTITLRELDADKLSALFKG